MIPHTAEELTAATDAALDESAEQLDRATAAADAYAVIEAVDEAMAVLVDRANVDKALARLSPDADLQSAAARSRERLVARHAEYLAGDQLIGVLDRISSDSLDEEARHYVTRMRRECRRAGAGLSAEARQRVGELRIEITRLGNAFQRNITGDKGSVRVPSAALDRLPEDFRRSHPADADGLVTITTAESDYHPFMSCSDDAAAREQVWRCARERGFPVNESVLLDLLTRRHELATALGWESWADYVVEDTMAGDVATIEAFLARLTDASSERCETDHALLLARKRVDEPFADELHPWDVSYLQDRIRAETAAFDSTALPPYLDRERVIAGVTALAERIFGIRFHAVVEAPVWHPSVQVFDVFDAHYEHDVLLGNVYFDLFARPGKSRQTAVFELGVGKPGRGRTADAVLVSSLPDTGGEPYRMAHGGVVTLLHELGHLIHHLLAGRGRWAGVGGIRTEFDFVEAPSQALEEWAYDPPTLAEFAVHSETGEPVPARLIDGMLRADRMFRATRMRNHLFLAAASLRLHRGNPRKIDLIAVERELTDRYLPHHYVEGSRRFLSFGHLVGYSALYYTYLWSKVIAKDLATRFDEAGRSDRRACADFRSRVLEAGGSAPAADLLERFLGRPGSSAAYEKWLAE